MSGKGNIAADVSVLPVETILASLKLSPPELRSGYVRLITYGDWPISAEMSHRPPDTADQNILAADSR